MDLDCQADIADLDTTLTTVERVLDVDGLRARIKTLEEAAADPNLWDDQARGQQVTSQLSHAQGELRRVEELRSRLDDLPVLYELAEESEDNSVVAEADAERVKLREDIEAMEVRTLLSGEYDEREAVVTIRSGAGGVDAADWAECSCGCTSAGPRRTVPGRGVRHLLCRRGGYQERDLRRASLPLPTAHCRWSRARTAWYASARSTTKADGRPRSPMSRCFPWWRRPTTSTFPKAICALMSIDRVGRAASR